MVIAVVVISNVWNWCHSYYAELIVVDMLLVIMAIVVVMVSGCCTY